MTMTSRN